MKKRPLANVEWRKYISVNNTILNRYLINYGDEFLNGILETIKIAQQNNFPSIVLIEFIKSDVVSVVEKKDYPIVLQRLLNLCERLEKYEICADIVKYQKESSIKKIQPTKKSHKIHTTNFW